MSSILMWLTGCLFGFTTANMIRHTVVRREIESLRKKSNSYEEALTNLGIAKGVEKFIYPFWPKRSKQEFKKWLKKEGIRW